MNNKYYNLECCILSCILIKPELINKIIIKDTDFKNFNNLFTFMKSFYSKFKTFDINLMYSVISNKYQFTEYITQLIELDCDINNFELYQQQLIDLINFDEKEQWKIEKIYQLSNDLVVHKINTIEFGKKVNEVYKNANEIFKKGEDKK